MKNIICILPVFVFFSCKVHHEFVHTVLVSGDTVKIKSAHNNAWTQPNASDSAWVAQLPHHSNYLVKKPLPVNKKVLRQRDFGAQYMDRFGNPVVRGFVLRKDSTSRQLRLAKAKPSPLEEWVTINGRRDVHLGASSIWSVSPKVSVLVAGDFFIENVPGMSKNSSDLFETRSLYAGAIFSPRKGLYLGGAIGGVSTSSEVYNSQTHPWEYVEKNEFQFGARLFIKGTFPKHFFFLYSNLLTRRFNMSGYWHTFIGPKTTAGVYINNVTVGIGPMIGGVTRNLIRISFAGGYNPLRDTYGFAIILH